MHNPVPRSAPEHHRLPCDAEDQLMTYDEGFQEQEQERLGSSVREETNIRGRTPMPSAPIGDESPTHNITTSDVQQPRKEPNNAGTATSANRGEDSPSSAGPMTSVGKELATRAGLRVASGAVNLGLSMAGLG